MTAAHVRACAPDPDPLAYLWRFAAVRVIRWYLNHRPGGTDRACAVGWLIGRLRGSYAPSPKRQAQLELVRGRLVDEMDDELDRMLDRLELREAQP